MLKRKVFAVGLALMLMVLVLPQGAWAGGIGYVDFEFLFNAHPEYESKNGELQVLAEDLTVQFQTQAETMESEAEIEQLARRYEAELDQFAENLRLDLIASVQEFIAQLADEMGIDIVVPDTLVIYGGINMTPLVLEMMYESYGISVPSHLRDFL